MAKRLAGRYGYPAVPGQFDITFHDDKLDEPLNWKKPRMIFVCSMSDLFHPDVSFKEIDLIFARFAVYQEHTFQILTKRPERMLEYMKAAFKSNPSLVCIELSRGSYKGKDHIYSSHSVGYPWPFPNVWFGVSVESQETADYRIPILLNIPAAIRFISIEPLIGPIDLRLAIGNNPSVGIDWIIAGCESGHKRRLTEISWIRMIKDYATGRNIPFFLKQMEINGKVIKMPFLDGQQWKEFPQPNQREI
jgi:protein gp37